MIRAFPFAVVLLACGISMPAHAQLFRPKAKVNPAQRVPELVVTAKTETDERKRAAAVEELRDFDAAKFTEIIPLLADLVTSDKSATVRLEALNVLVKARPVNSTAANAIQKAANDDTMRVRVAAKTAWLRYQLAGYSATEEKKDATAGKPGTAPTAPAANTALKSSNPPAPAKNGDLKTVNPEPIMIVPMQPTAPAVNNIPRPLPIGPPSEATTPPVEGPRLEGPRLGPKL